MELETEQNEKLTEWAGGSSCQRTLIAMRRRAKCIHVRMLVPPTSTSFFPRSGLAAFDTLQIFSKVRWSTFVAWCASIS